MKKILIEQVRDRNGTSSFVFYEQGNFTKPMMILTELEASNLRDRITEAQRGGFNE